MVAATKAAPVVVTSSTFRFKELKALCDPMKKEIIVIHKKLDTVNKEFKSLGPTCQKKERKYKEALDAFNEKNKEKVQLITTLMEVFEEIG